MTTENPFHADVCSRLDKWSRRYTSRSDNNHVIALEITCKEHDVHFWFPPLEEMQEYIRKTFEVKWDV